jgi:hypothetical protein
MYRFFDDVGACVDVYILVRTTAVAGVCMCSSSNDDVRHMSLASDVCVVSHFEVTNRRTIALRSTTSRAPSLLTSQLKKTQGASGFGVVM